MAEGSLCGVLPFTPPLQVGLVLLQLPLPVSELRAPSSRVSRAGTPHRPVCPTRPQQLAPRSPSASLLHLSHLGQGQLAAVAPSLEGVGGSWDFHAQPPALPHRLGFYICGCVHPSTAMRLARLAAPPPWAAPTARGTLQTHTA